MDRLQFCGHLRGLLGRRYSVADEEGGDGTLRLIVLRRGADEMLALAIAPSWIDALQLPPTDTEDRVLLKHLAIYVKRFFAHPEQLPEQAFPWPGTAQSRSRVRFVLDPRRKSLAERRQQE